MYVILFAILFMRHGGKILKVVMLSGMMLIIAMGLWERYEKAPGLMLFRASVGSRACLVMLDRGWDRAFVLLPGCGASAKVAVQWLKENGVTTVDGLFVTGGVMRRGAQEWLRRMPVRSVVTDDEWRRSWESSRLAASGVHVEHWQMNMDGGYEYCHAGHIWRMSDRHGEIHLRVDGGNRGLNIFYDENENGLGLLSFICGDYSGNGVMKLGMPDRNIHIWFN
jgi:hypothetical protein